MGMLREGTYFPRSIMIFAGMGSRVAVQHQRSSRRAHPSRDHYDSVNHSDDAMFTVPAHLLLMMIQWTRHLPTFVDLSIPDQVRVCSLPPSKQDQTLSNREIICSQRIIIIIDSCLVDSAGRIVVGIISSLGNAIPTRTGQGCLTRK